MQTQNNIHLGDEVTFTPLDVTGKVVSITKGLAGYEFITLEITNNTDLGRSYHDFASNLCKVKTPSESPITVSSNISLGDYVVDEMFKEEGVVVSISYNADSMVSIEFENPNLGKMDDLEPHSALASSVVIHTNHSISNLVREALQEKRETLNVGDAVEHVITKHNGRILNILETTSGRFIAVVTTGRETNFLPFSSDLLLFKKA